MPVLPGVSRAEPSANFRIACHSPAVRVNRAYYFRYCRTTTIAGRCAHQIILCPQVPRLTLATPGTATRYTSTYRDVSTRAGCQGDRAIKRSHHHFVVEETPHRGEPRLDWPVGFASRFLCANHLAGFEQAKISVAKVLIASKVGSRVYSAGIGARRAFEHASNGRSLLPMGFEELVLRFGILSIRLSELSPACSPPLRPATIA